MPSKPIRWTWARMVEVLVSKGYACGKASRYGRVSYEVFTPFATGGLMRRFDTVEEVRDAFGFHDDKGVE